MRTIQKSIAFAYYRLSREEAQSGESSSITNQRMIVSNYCKQNGITLVREFVDDGYSGGNFDRPDFQNMMRELDKGLANTIITKDLSRLGRDMRESSYYAEQFFPEHAIRYIAIADNFDSERENIMAPFQFAMNEVYLRDGSKKVKDVLRNKREEGLYCACAPYGYKKAKNNNNLLIPDEMTAPIVQRIFHSAARGDSSRKIAMDLNKDGVFPPLKYRVLFTGTFTEEGATRASDVWNYTTIKRILKNQVYLGHTILGKSKKVSVKSKKKIPVPKEEWAVTKNTHEPLVSEEIFQRAQENLGKGTRDYRAYDRVRKSIFSGIAYCALCGHALCSCGTVYKGEREKYWYLGCINKRKDISNPCTGSRIRYETLMTLVKDDLNSLLALSDEQIDAIVENIIQAENSDKAVKAKKARAEKLEARLKVIDKIIPKIYVDNAEGRLEDERLEQMVDNLQKESASIHKELSELNDNTIAESKSNNYKMFFELTKKYTYIEKLDRDILLTFVDRIEVGPKILPQGMTRATHDSSPFEQSIRIFYKFVGEMEELNTE